MSPRDKPTLTPVPAPIPAAPPPPTHDVALIHGRTDDGAGLKILRSRNDSLEAGVLRPLVDGRAIAGEVVTLEPRKEFPLLCDVKVELDARPQTPTPAPTRHGPAQVATDDYRRNWDAIWKRRSDDDLPN